MVIHVQQNKVKVSSENEDPNNNHKNLTFELQTTIGIYVSRICADLIQQRSKATNNIKLSVTKLSNITSTRRMISAINSLQEWPQYRSLLKPMTNDRYFQWPANYDLSNVSPTDGFNAAQSKTIAIAECMFDDLFDQMHLVEGPPGM